MATMNKAYTNVTTDCVKEATDRIANLEAELGWNATMALLTRETGCTVAELEAAFNESRSA